MRAISYQAIRRLYPESPESKDLGGTLKYSGVMLNTRFEKSLRIPTDNKPQGDAIEFVVASDRAGGSWMIVLLGGH